MRDSRRGGPETFLAGSTEGVCGAAHSVGREEREVAFAWKKIGSTPVLRERRFGRIGFRHSLRSSRSSGNRNAVRAPKPEFLKA